MFTIVGLIVVFGAVLGGYAMGGGPFGVLIQPNELVVIIGAALGTVLVAAPGKMRGRVIGSIKKAFSSGAPQRSDFLDLLKMQFEIYNFARKNGLIALEPHVEQPENSSIFKKYPSFTKRHHALAFFQDALRQMVNGLGAEELSMLLENELDTLAEEEHIPISLIKATGDALPGLGIVAAVLGIVITMGHLDGGPAEIGHHVAAALVGTFLGILVCYGLLQPLATNIELQGVTETKYLRCLKEGVVASARGLSPAFAVEFARKALFSDERPDAKQTDEACAQVKAGA